MARGSSPLARGLRRQRYRVGPHRPDHPRSRGVYAFQRFLNQAVGGSSPLARGLRVRHLGRPVRRRIIPARAGFTAAPASSEAPTEDHPRSRGVYPLANSRPRSVSGSSPLARGLHPATEADLVASGIIPARAGFTGRRRRRWPSARDHPRSRGVYPRCAPAPCTRRRIIPARAGFTSGGAAPCGRHPDHPRSRGVYSRTVSRHSVLWGSSPLARGLPAHRAGTGAAPADHPRSRGVYHVLRLSEAPDTGSSPLARGLRQDQDPHRPDDRIIPARAGFTAPRPGLAPGQRDHPRSRGVYDSFLVFPPLWRGIIPARAGFTRCAPRAGRPSADHPRSRGVYSGGSGSRGDGAGSSPLARGLQTETEACMLLIGIIPARAGFTAPRAAAGPPPKDHPRSRGVYRWWDGGGHIEYGSSPLARGLRRSKWKVSPRGGIIPARAGFTTILPSS